MSIRSSFVFVISMFGNSEFLIFYFLFLDEPVMQTYDGQTASTSWDSVSEPFFCQLDDDISPLSPPSIHISHTVNHDNNSNSSAEELQERVMREQLKMLQKQMDVLDAQKEVYLLQKEVLLKELNVHKSNRDF